MATSTGRVIWFTGLSASGKTTISTAVYQRLLVMGIPAEHLDGDVMRERLSKGLGFSREDRNENIRRISFVAEMLVRHGVTVLVSAISPYREGRDEARSRIGSAFVEVYVDAPLAVCEERDVKGLYKKARAGLIHSFTGVDDPYEPPLRAELICRTAIESVNQSVEKVLEFVGRPRG
jgi:adenylylsulfate kinase